MQNQVRIFPNGVRKQDSIGPDTFGSLHLETFQAAMQYSRRARLIGGKNYGLGGINKADSDTMDGLHFKLNGSYIPILHQKDRVTGLACQGDGLTIWRVETGCNVRQLPDAIQKSLEGKIENSTVGVSLTTKPASR